MEVLEETMEMQEDTVMIIHASMWALGLKKMFYYFLNSPPK